ncbi:MAG: class I SAM-dependent methyltransferase [Byssovorax sp.]
MTTLTVSDTAYSIAAMRAEEASLPASERLFDDPYALIFAAAGEHAREGTDRLTVTPFFREGIRLRTRGIDDCVRDAFADGIRQLVLLGAGLDARALRLPELRAPDARAFEIDLPGILERKRALLDAAGVAIPDTLRTVTCDFTTDFTETLRASLLDAGFDPARPAIFVWEGVLPYIGQDAVERSLRFMHAIGAPGSRVVFDFSEYAFARGTAEEHVKNAGFGDFRVIGFDDLTRRHLGGEPSQGAMIMKIGVAVK